MILQLWFGNLKNNMLFSYYKSNTCLLKKTFETIKKKSLPRISLSSDNDCVHLWGGQLAQITQQVRCVQRPSLETQRHVRDSWHRGWSHGWMGQLGPVSADICGPGRRQKSRNMDLIGNLLIFMWVTIFINTRVQTKHTWGLNSIFVALPVYNQVHTIFFSLNILQ